MIVEIQNIQPLDDQFGSDPKRSVPEMLEHTLFGKSTSPADSPNAPQALFALMDAARIPGLEEHLSASKLQHKCLFKGNARAALGGSAPWLVQLENGSTFTRNLFTEDGSDAPWQFWRHNAALFIRTAKPIEDLWRHLRKFTKLKDDQGRETFFRFWEPGILEAFCARKAKLPALEKTLRIIFGGQRILFHAPHHGSMFEISPEPLESREPLPADLRENLKRARFYANMFEQAEDFHENYPEEAARYGHTSRALWPSLFEAVDEIYAAGLMDARLRARFLLLAIIKYPRIWPALCEEPGWQAVKADPPTADDRFRDLCAIMKHYGTRTDGAIKVWW